MAADSLRKCHRRLKTASILGDAPLVKSTNTAPQQWPAAPVDMWVAAALAGEADALRGRLVGRESLALPGRPRGLSVSVGRLADRRIGLLTFGVGAAAAARGARWLGERLVESCGGGSPRVLLIGLAGGLDPALDPLQRVGVRRVCAVVPDRSSSAPLPVTELDAWGEEGTATCVSVPEILYTRAEKRQVWALAHDRAGAVVDLETATWCRELRRLVPEALLSSVRVVSDGAAEELPQWMRRCVDDDGALSPRRVALAALAHPLDWGRLSALRRRLIEGSRILADAVEAGP